MDAKLPEELIKAITEDISNRSTFANKETISSCLNGKIYNYLDFQKNLADSETKKLISLHNRERNAFSVKGYNVIINMKELWRQLPSTLEDLVVFFTSDEITNIFASILSFIKNATKLFGIELGKKEEAVLVVIAYLSQHEKSINFDNIFKFYNNSRRNSAIFPIIKKDERQQILESLIALKCILQDSEGNYKSEEKILL